MSRQVKEFEVVNLGVMNPDYFPGFGVAFTPFDDCVNGIGTSEAEAFEDCLESLAQNGVVDVDNLEARAIAEYGKPSDESSMVDDDGWHHMGIRWR